LILQINTKKTKIEKGYAKKGYAKGNTTDIVMRKESTM